MLLTNRADIKKQSGAVLVMALVMLAVLTLIGVASMDSSSVQLKIAGNTQDHDVAFQAAQAIIAFVVSDDEDNPIDYHDIVSSEQEMDYPLAGVTDAAIGVSGASGISGRAVVTLVGCSAGIGDSLEEGKGQKFNFYDARVTGYNKWSDLLSNSNSVQVQGVRYFAAGCG